MSDPVETTAAGATRVLFGTIAFICLMVGIEGVTGIEKISVGLSALLIAAGAICAYAAFFWETAKKVLSQDAQNAIGQFSRHRATKAALLFAILLSIILSPYIEQRRWPFSYPNDPSIIADNESLKNTLSMRNSEIGQERELANKWRFASALRQGRACSYQIQITSKASLTLGFWKELLQYGGWNENASAVALASAPGGKSTGITLRINGDTGPSAQCAGTLQRALTDIYPNPTSRIAARQRTDFLISCPDCVQIEIDY
jgi:hypothetical protein